MIHCTACGNENIDTSKFCKTCGKPLTAQPETGTLKIGKILDKRYEIKRLVKSGGMGAVYEGMDKRFNNTTCAVKEMFSHDDNPEEQDYMIKRFREEADLLHNLRHPNLPVVKDYFIEKGRYYLVMDYIEGYDLQYAMRSYGKSGIPEDIVVDWAKQILDALDYLHSQNPPIVYRDLKPANIMVRRSDNRIILVDFGIARPVDRDSLTSKTIVGTPAFAPEELLQGNPEPRSDIYSLGATIHSLLTGTITKSLFTFEPVRQLNPAVSPEMEGILIKALSRNSEERYSSAKEMKEALEYLSVISMSNMGSSYEPTVPPSLNHMKIEEPLIQYYPSSSPPSQQPVQPVIHVHISQNQEPSSGHYNTSESHASSKISDKSALSAGNEPDDYKIRQKTGTGEIKPETVKKRSSKGAILWIGIIICVLTLSIIGCIFITSIVALLGNKQVQNTTGYGNDGGYNQPVKFEITDIKFTSNKNSYKRGDKVEVFVTFTGASVDENKKVWVAVDTIIKYKDTEAMRNRVQNFKEGPHTPSDTIGGPLYLITNERFPAGTYTFIVKLTDKHTGESIKADKKFIIQ